MAGNESLYIHTGMFLCLPLSLPDPGPLYRARHGCSALCRLPHGSEVTAEITPPKGHPEVCHLCEIMMCISEAHTCPLCRVSGYILRLFVVPSWPCVEPPMHFPSLRSAENCLHLAGHDSELGSARDGLTVPQCCTAVSPLSGTLSDTGHLRVLLWLKVPLSSVTINAACPWPARWHAKHGMASFPAVPAPLCCRA